jgi:hypothetical protein
MKPYMTLQDRTSITLSNRAQMSFLAIIPLCLPSTVKKPRSDINQPNPASSRDSVSNLNQNHYEHHSTSHPPAHQARDNPDFA